ncbi:MAG: phosphotransferase family protein [Geminicoccaceae bacterium]|nr:phosphotransferase family protein [Geminicoccaceae bacterium]
MEPAVLIGHHALEGWLARVLHARTVRVTAAEQLSGGAIQENWGLEIDLDGEMRNLVLRKDSPATIAASRSRAEEYQLFVAAHAAGVRVPEPLGFCDDPEVLDAPFAVVERCRGVAYGPRIVRDPSLGGDRRALGEELGRQLARIHAIVPGDDLQAILGARPIDPAQDVVATLRQWLDGMSADRPGLEWALRQAEIHAPEMAETTLTHQDFRTGNFLVDGQGLTAILDWEFAGWSDPMSDIGWFCAECWRFSRPDLEGGGLCERSDFYRGYEAESGRPIDDIRVHWWEIIAHIRWAVIALQQGHRHASGEERSLHLALTGRMGDGLELAALRMTRPGAFAS